MVQSLEVRAMLTAPVLAANALAINENASQILTTSNLNATDADNDPLTFTVSSVTHGQFELVSAAGTAITTFTLAQVSGGNVRFVHDSSELAPTFQTSVSDGTTSTAPTAATITFSNVNDQDPVLGANSLTLNEGGSVVLTTANLDATDADLPGDALVFTVSNVTRGRFELVSNPGTAITTFSRTGLVAGNVRFVHDGSEFAPTYSVAVSDGRISTSAAAATITFTNVSDQAPVLTTNSLSISEGATVVLSTSNLNATDADLPGDTLTYTASNVTRGQFELTSAPGTAITSFTHAQLTGSAVRFVHDGSESAPTYSVSVSDGTNSTTAAAATITFTNVNDQTPVLTANTLTISEGGSIVLTTTNLNASDADLPGDTLSFTVSGVTNGRFELTSAAGTAITTFTRAQLVAGVVRFVHNGGEAAPAYSVAVSDGTNTSAAAAATINFTNVNDAPVLTVNTLMISEGAIVALTTSNLEATDADLPGDTLTYTVSNVTRGRFELTSAPGTAITSFTRTQVVAGTVQFVHDGAEQAPTYSVSVSDGTTSTTAAAASITFTNVNDQTPVLSANTLAISEGATVTITTSFLNATDADLPGDTLTFMVSGVTNGRFELSTAAGTPILTFTRAQVVAGTVRFVHDGGETAPAYSVSVSDGTNSTPAAAATITFTNVNDAPVLTANSLSITEGGMAILSAANLEATDADIPADTLTYNVSNVTRGRFELVSNPGTAITSFSRANLIAGNVQFVHDGSEFAPTYSVSVNDTKTNTAAAAATITFTNVNDQAPVLSVNTLAVSEGGTVVVTTARLNATDADLPGDSLTFTVSNVTHGQFELVSAPGTAITTFSKTALAAGNVQFVHDGSELAPTYDVSVSDGTNSTTAAAATVTFTNVNDQNPVLTVNTLTVQENATVTLSTANFDATDADLPGDTLTFNVTNVTRGRFAFSSAIGIAITSFTRAQLVSGIVRFVHDGSELAPTFDISVTDGAHPTTPVAGVVSFTNVSDQTPVVTANALTISEGGSVVLSTANLNATDADIPGETLSFNVTNVTRGQFELVSAAGTAITSFTLADVTGGNVRFVHDGSEQAPTYSVSATDGTLSSTPAAATITFTNVNDQPPVLSTNNLPVTEGATLVLTTAHLNATDADLPGDPLTFTVSGVTNGRFELSTAAGTPITTFTRAQIVAGVVRFVHDGSETAPTFQVSVSDGATSTTPVAGVVTFTGVNDQTPVLTANTLAVTENATAVLTTANFNATDADLPGDTLTFNVTNLTRGRFELVSAPGVAITSFTLANVAGGNVQFVHDGSELAPTMSISVSDGVHTTTAAATTITFTNVNDQTPVVTANTLTISEGGTVVLSTSNLNATDADLPGDTLSFIVSDVANGGFELVANPGVAVTMFSRAAVVSGAVQFVHDGSELAPSFKLAATDGTNTSTPAAATINFTNVNDQPPVLTVNTLTLNENATVTLSTANFEATDADLPGDTLTFTVSNVTRGRFAFSNATGIAITSFTRAQLVSGIVRFVHDASEFAPTFNVSVSDGATSTTPAAATVFFTNVNDQIPVLTNRNLAVTENGTVILTTANIDATDADLPGDTLTFVVSNVTRGQFERVSAPGTAITSFTRDDIVAGDVQFVHDGSEAAPTFSVLVGDGVRNTSTLAATITFTPVNDQTPALTVNTLAITEGATVTLTTAMLNATDADLPADTLTFNVSNVQNGRFELSSAAGTAITSFTRTQLAAGGVRFVHDGGELAPTYSVSVSDGLNVTPPAAALITFTNVNDQTPVLITNTLTISEGATVVITTAELDATDADLPGDTLTYLISNVTRGRFELVANAGTAITSFTRAQVLAGAVQFVHDGGEAAPTYRVAVNDGARTISAANATITFTNVNDAPVVTANSLSISEGGSVVLTSSNVNATDADLPGDTLTFDVSDVVNGRFEMTSQPNVPIFSFSKADVAAGRVRFVHDGGELAPSYKLSANDGTVSTTPVATTITFTNVNDQAPVLIANSLTINEGELATLSTANLDATDADLPGDTLTFLVSNVTGGQFELVSSPNAAISSFTRAQLVAGNVRFRHNGGEAPPSYSVAVRDGVRNSPVENATITFTNVNDVPVLTTNRLTISEGQTLVLSTANFNATDADLPGDQLTFNVTNLTNGQFELATNRGTAVTSFTLDDLVAGNVLFVHDGGELAPTMKVSVSDSLDSTTPATTTISFTNVNDPPTLLARNLAVTEGGTVIISTANLDASDPDLTNDSLVFTVTGVTGGRFEFGTQPGSAITRFTRAQIVAGTVRFVHDGSETAPAFNVSVSDGRVSTTEVPAMVTFTQVNDPPTLITRSLTIAEGSTVVLSTANFNASDPDLPGDTLTFNVTSVARGRFEYGIAPGVAITSFSLADINAGNVRFVHDGSEQAPAFNVSVTDGTVATAPVAGLITFTNVNDIPVLTTNTLPVTEGGTTVLTLSHFNATDGDPNDTITFTVSNVTRGRFELASAPGTAITTFSRASLVAGNVRFIHDGSEFAPTMNVSVSDGSVTTTPAATNVVFTNVNDPPVLTAKQLSVVEGASVIVTTVNLNATDADLPANTLTFTISTVTNGQFEFVSNPGIGVFTFTLADVASGNIRFVHNGSETAPSFKVAVGDGTVTTTPVQATITFTNVNDMPTLTANSLTVDEGGSKVLSLADLNASDPDLPANTLTFTVTNVTRGRFELVSNPGTAITTFSKNQVAAGSVRFVHDGSEITPTYNVSVSDGSVATGPAAANVTLNPVNDPPTLTANLLRIVEGGTAQIGVALSNEDSTGALNAFDSDDTPDTISFNVTNVQRGRFELGANPGVAVVTFTLADVMAGNVFFIHDGSELVPTYSISATDGKLATTPPSVVTVTFVNVNDETPVITAKTLTISEGASTILTTANLNATDADLPGDALTFVVTNVTNGRFERTNAAGVAIFSFTRAQLVAGNIRFVHNGSEFAPSFDVKVTDGTNESVFTAATINFTNVNDQTPVMPYAKLTIEEGQTKTLTTDDIDATDADLPGDLLTFTVSNVTRGRFELSTAPGAAITVFTRTQLENGLVRFVHDGGETAPTFSIKVSDGKFSSAVRTATVTFIRVNDLPTLTVSTLKINEGGSITLSSSILNATDPDLPADNLTFEVSNVTNGRFELVAVPGTAIFSFTKANVAAGRVRFVHNGSEFAPAFDVAVRDTPNSITAPISATIVFTNVNDQPPIMTVGQLVLNEGDTILITTGILNTTDADIPGNTLTYSVSNVTRGRFERVTAPGRAITTFTQTDVENGQIQFVHDGGELAPSYRVQVSDGARNSAAVQAPIVFTAVNDLPVLITNKLVLSNGFNIAVTTNNLNATDADGNVNNLTFNVTDVQHGQFTLNGLNTTTFTLNDVKSSRVRFIHDGSRITPSYNITVSDGIDTTDPVAGGVAFGYAPTIGNVSIYGISIRNGEAPMLLYPTATVGDADTPFFNGGTLTVGYPQASRDAGDRILVLHQGDGAGQVGVDGNEIRFGGVTIGTFTGGFGDPLQITFNDQASVAAVQAVMRRIAVSTVSGTPFKIARNIEAVLNDGNGGTSVTLKKAVTIVG
jgi:hypothetical protein